MKKILALFGCALSACVAKKDNQVDTLAASSNTSVTSTDTTVQPGAPSGQPAPVIPAGRSAPPTTTSPSTSWTVTERGIGPLTAGLTVAEASKAIGGGFAVPAGSDPSCTYARLTKAPPGLAVMLQSGKIARVEVRDGTIATAEGARIGDPEARINSLYTGRVTTTPHKYITGGHYLTVTPVDGSQNRIVFETDGQIVKEYRAGALPAVAYVERCG